VQLGFDSQHFTLPVLAYFLDLNMGPPISKGAVRQIQNFLWFLIRVVATA
jgi:hypothetical protein